MIDCEIIDSTERLAGIADEWNSFSSKLDEITPFQLPAWQLPWWSQFASGVLHTLVFRRDGSMVGIVPCFLHEWNGRRQLTLVGSGVSDYLEPALDRTWESEILACLRQHLVSFEDWDLCDWQDLCAESPLKGMRGENCLFVEASGDAPCSRIRLVGDFDEYWHTRPKDLRRNLRRYKEKALAAGPLSFETVDGADANLLQTLIRLHGLRWRERGESGMIAQSHSAEFLRKVTTRLGEQGMIRFFVLRYTGAITAIILAFPFQGTVYSYLSGMDPEHQSFGFGRTLLYEAIRRSFEEGFAQWDFLRGEEAYKFSWGAEVIPKVRLRITRKT